MGQCLSEPAPVKKDEEEPPPKEEPATDAIDAICKVGENLWMSGCEGSKDKEVLQANGITHILNMVGDTIYEIPQMGGKDQCYFPEDFTYKIVTANDNPSQNIEKFFAETSPFILQGTKAGGCLVHCYAGVSRSCTCVVAFLMDTYGLSAEEALAQVQKGRPVAQPNEGFWIQLKNYEQVLAERKKGGQV